MDRRVHASHPDGTEVVRYDRAGRWAIEYPGHPRTPVTLHWAVREALRDGMEVRFNTVGGSAFDRAIRKAASGG